jgi:hypothetical protein
MSSRTRKKKRKKTQSKLSLKKAVKAIAKSIYVRMVKLPEEERERDIAAFERAVSKKLRRLRAKK